jgi:hypothetical protein
MILSTLPAPPHSATNRPPGFSARQTPAIAASGSRIQCSAALEKTASNSAAKASRVPSITCALSPRARAPLTWSALASTATTSAAAAIFSVSAPSPQPRSRMRSPGVGASRSSSGAPSTATKPAVS